MRGKVDWFIISFWLVGIVLISVVGFLFLDNIDEQGKAYNKRYELCINADKQWIDGNCINK
jgi:hypothetical protein